jgi:gas vesicle protein
MTNKSPNMTMGFLVGLGIGATAGILLAPRKGEETRQQIQQKAVQARDKIKDQLHRQKDKTQEGLDNAADTSRKLASTAKEQLSEATGDRQDASSTRTKGRS